MLQPLRGLALPSFVFLISCGSSPEPAPKSQVAEAPPPPAQYRDFVPRLESVSTFPEPSCVEFAGNFVKQMSLDAKIGQTIQSDYGRVGELSNAAKLNFGSVLNGGGEGPPNNNPKAWLEWISAIKVASSKNEHGIPLLYGVDAVHGHGNVKGATIFPHNIGLGASRDAELVELIGRATAEEVAATGIQWNFAPVFASNRNIRWGRSYEAYGDSPELAAELGSAFIRGSQGAVLGSKSGSILATAKHFAGDGGTKDGIDRGDTIADSDEYVRP